MECAVQRVDELRPVTLVGHERILIPVGSSFRMGILFRSISVYLLGYRKRPFQTCMVTGPDSDWDSVRLFVLPLHTFLVASSRVLSSLVCDGDADGVCRQQCGVPNDSSGRGSQPTRLYGVPHCGWVYDGVLLSKRLFFDCAEPSVSRGNLGSFTDSYLCRTNTFFSEEAVSFHSGCDSEALLI